MMLGSRRALTRGVLMISARLLIYTGLLLLAAPMTHAAMEASVQMQGRVLKPTCSLNNGKSLDVDFGTVNIENPQSKPITLNMDCPGGNDIPINFVIRTFAGNVSDSAGTNMSGLYIKFFVGRMVYINDVNSFTPNALRALSAMPVILPGYNLKGGYFYTTVTLSAEYN